MSKEYEKDRSPVTTDELRKVLKKLQTEFWNAERNAESKRTGRVLTVIDGVVSDPEQRKAVKDLIHNAMKLDNWELHPDWAGCIAEVLGFSLYPKSELGPADIDRHNPLKNNENE